MWIAFDEAGEAVQRSAEIDDVLALLLDGARQWIAWSALAQAAGVDDDFLFLLVTRGQNDNGSPKPFPQLAQHVLTIMSGNPRSRITRSGGCCAARRMAFSPVSARGHAEARLLQPQRRDLADRRIVLHEQHVLVHRQSL